MKVYERDRYENWDDEEQEEEEGSEDGYEETHQPTKEEMDYLELRQKLKEKIRKKLKKELGASNSGSRNKNIDFRKDSYGSFFGPACPAIAQRVIEESKTLLENPELTAKILRAKSMSNRSDATAHFKSKPQHKHPAAPTNGLRKKAEILKQTRDYSFLQSSGAKFIGVAKNLTPTKLTSTNTDARHPQVLPRGKPSISEKGITNSRDGRKPVRGSVHSMPKVALGNISDSSVGVHKKFGNNHAPGSGVHARSKEGFTSKHAELSAGKLASSTTKKPSDIAPNYNSLVSQSGVRKSMPAFGQSRNISAPNTKPLATIKPLMQRREYHGANIPNGSTKHAPHSSREQHNSPPPKPSARHTHSDQRPKAKPKRPRDDDAGLDVEGGRAISMIRKMFGYNPNRFRDDDDDNDMEANFDDIMREERKSARIARQEDEEQLRMIEEEERRERAKKRKLSTRQ